MHSIMDQLRTALRAAGPGQWQDIADAINRGRVQQDHVSIHLMRKIAYGDRENPRVQTIQPLLDHFGIGAQEAA